MPINWEAMPFQKLLTDSEYNEFNVAIACHNFSLTLSDIECGKVKKCTSKTYSWLKP